MEVVLIDVTKAMHADPFTNRAYCANTSVFAQTLLIGTVRPVCKVSLRSSGTRKYCIQQGTAPLQFTSCSTLSGNVTSWESAPIGKTHNIIAI